MMPNIRMTAARLAALLVLAALLCAGMQGALVENKIIVSIGDYANIGLDPTISSKLKPEIGGWQNSIFLLITRL